MNFIREIAIALAERSFPSVAVGASGKPIERGWTDFSADPETVAHRLRMLNATGLALVLRAPYFALDLDRNHAPGVDGIAQFAAIIPQGESIPPGPRTRTPRGGMHMILRAPDDLHIASSAGKLALGVDVRGFRSCVKCPPTPGYRWVPSVLDTPPPMAPAWLLELVAKKPCPPPPPAPCQSFTGAADRLAQHVFRNEVLKVAKAKTGTRNAQLFASAASLGGLCSGGELPEAETKNALRIAAHDCGLTKEDGVRTVQDLIDRAFARGLQTPRNLDHLRTPIRRARHG